ncbi:50S ribosomal protein L10 [Candidatus Anaplasma sp. TIGMIC]|uniref:50S ribosomal protein L10 n=1 Tax=Candidatus Anaplasma sp. TIGMIC TaxID=3020713 RepID=UPI00232E2EA5|nr:50S ribosomal protein L10 [Candidatus Anaplasma sp. TIGMIC]MDB1135355.1 50S ribosomal protein L10 [Candidatus Anaplasma sp. TIGMIC]
MKRIDKERHLGNVSGLFARFGSFVLANFRSMTAGDFAALRKELKAAGCGVSVVKNSIACIALKESDKEGLSDKFRGAVFVAYSDDVVTLSKTLYAFVKSRADKVSLVCAYDGGQILSAEQVVFFATLPSLEELRMRIAGLIAYGIPMRLASCLKAIGDK